MNANIISVILKGMVAQDQDLCIKRLSSILSNCNNEPTDALVNGVIVDALIASDQDEALVRADFTKQYDRDNWKRFEVFVDDYNTVRVRGVYDKTVYCKTQEDADSLLRTGRGDYHRRADEVYQIPVVLEDKESRCYNREDAFKYGITLVLN
jgi:hypothetical protein